MSGAEDLPTRQAAGCRVAVTVVPAVKVLFMFVVACPQAASHMVLAVSSVWGVVRWRSAVSPSRVRVQLYRCPHLNTSDLTFWGLAGSHRVTPLVGTPADCATASVVVRLGGPFSQGPVRGRCGPGLPDD